MRPPLHGTVLVTGASSGIGDALARRVARTAHAVVLVARREARLQALAEALRAEHPSLTVEVFPCDLGDLAAVDALAIALDGRVDVLVNNAGVGDMKLLEQADADKLETMIAVNVQGLTRLTRRLLPPMLARRSGGILNISSGYGLVWTPGVAAYAGTKAYVHFFSECLRSEVRSRGVVVTEVCPGPVDTEFEERAGGFFGIDAPAFVFQAPDACARQALRAFGRGRALVVPGWNIRLTMIVASWTPAWLLRLIMRPTARFLRGRSGV